MWAWKDDPDPNLLPVVAVLLILIFTLGLVDLSLDLGLRDPTHLILEVAFLLLCLVSALFLLKGYSHKEIANLTDKSERTVWQHSVVVYRKSGLAGRAELAALFLEDLLLPMEAAPENR